MNETAVSLDKLEKKFGDFTAVNKVSFQVKQGEIFGFLGPNGAGKSTTIRMLCGILTPTSGKGMVAGFDINREQEKIKESIGYMSQRFSLYEDLTVDENIDFFSGLYKLSPQKKKERKEWIMEMAGIREFRSRLTSTLSGGWKQRLALGCSIIHTPPIMFLDEPTSGVDPIARNNFWVLIKQMAKQGTTVFVTTHYMDEAEHCHRAALIYRGAIISMGTPDEMKAQCMHEEVLEIELPAAETWIAKLSKLDSIDELALFGSTLHAVVPDAKKATETISQVLKDNGLKNFRITKIKASLEDAFVSLIESYDKKGIPCEHTPG